MRKKLKKKSLFINQINSLTQVSREKNYNSFDLKKKLDFAISQHQKGSFEKALKAYEEFREIDKKNPICNTNLALLFSQINEIQNSLNLYEETIDKNPNFINAYINFSSLLINLKEFKKAAIVCKTGLKINPESVKLLINSSTIEYLNNNFLAAKEQISKAHVMNPKDINIQSILLNSEYKLKNDKYIFNFINNLFREEINKKEIQFLITKSRLMNNLNLSLNISKRLLEIYPEDNKLQADILGLLRETSNINEALEFGKKYNNASQADEDFYINYGSLHFDLGNLKEASSLLNRAIKINPNSEIAHLNLGAIYKEQGLLKKAENETKLALSLNPKIANGYYNLAAILQDLGNSGEALKISLELRDKYTDSAKIETLLANIYMSKGDMENTKLAICNSLNKDIKQYRCHFLMSLLKEDEKIKYLANKTMDIDLKQINSNLNKIDILFAKSNIMHSRKKFKEASEFLALANKLKKTIYKSDAEDLKKKADKLFLENKSANNKELTLNKEVNNVFIVGMPRCGSTLLESILTTNKDIIGLGETLNIENFYNHLSQKINKKNNFKKFIGTENKNILVDKQLYNFMFAGFILNNIENSRIIHCLRNPLDNILSIHRAHFLSGNRFSSSLEDTLDIYLMHLKIINKYKNIYPNHIYTICYDNLVLHPEKEIKLLVNWLNLKWENCYLEHHKFSRDVQTASKIQVRSPINSKSLGNWKKYKNIFQSYLKENSKLSEISDLTKEFKFELPLI